MRTISSFVVVVSMLLALGACRKAMPTAPTDNTPAHQQPTSEAPHYEPLGTRHYLVGENGEPTKIWAAIVQINPLRGSRIVTGPFNREPDCSKVCYSVTIQFGVDADLPPAMGNVLFKSYWTLDGNVVQETAPGSGSPIVCSGGALRGTEGQCTAASGPGSGGSTTYRTFNFVPNFLTVTGEYTYIPGNGGGSRRVTGKTSFETGYQPVR